MYSIVQAPNEILRTPAKSVDFKGEKLIKIINEMIETMLAQKDPEGVGLAANQVNLPWKIFVARFGTKKTDKIHTFVNPKIIDYSQDLQPTDDDKKTPLEGCLSKPDYYGSVKRFKWVTVEFYDEHGKRMTKKYDNFAATVIQHEMDHLDGKIFIERILEQKGKLYKITRTGKKGKEEWDEIEL